MELAFTFLFSLLGAVAILYAGLRTPTRANAAPASEAAPQPGETP